MYLRKPVRERFLNMGKERRWFNKSSLRSKIEEVKKVVKSEGASSSILTNSETVFINLEDEVIDNDESNTSFEIIDNGSDNGDEDEVDDDDFDFGAVAEDPIGSFSDLNPDSFGEINHGTNLDISKQKENSLSNKTDLLNGKIVEHSNESEISAEYQAEVFSSHSKRENSSSDDNGHIGSSDDDEEDDTNDNKSYACKDLQCSSVEGETHAAKSDSESDSSVELTRPRFRRVHKRNFIEVISISDSPFQSSEASCIAQSSSHNTIAIEDSSISADSPIKTNEVSSVEKPYSLSNSEEYFDNLNDNSKGDDDASINDECFDNSYEIQQEPDRVTPLLVNSHEVDGDGESNLSRESTSVKSSRNDHSNNNFKDIIISSPINPNKMSSVAESCSYEGYYVNNGHVHNDQEYDDDDDDDDDDGCDDEDEDEDVMYSDAEQEPDHLTPLLVNSNERAGENEGDLSAELIRHKPSKVIEDIDITDSAVKTREEYPSKELGSLSNNEEYCDNGDGNNEHGDTDNDDDDANEDVRNEITEQDPHHLASFLVKSDETDGDSGSDVSTDLIHPLESRSYHSRRDYSYNTCNVIEDVSVAASPVKTAEVSAVEECYSHNNSKRCSDNENDSAGHDGIDRDYTEDDVIGNIEDNEEESVDLVNSHEVNSDDESNLLTESTRPKSSMNNNNSDAIEDASFPYSPLKSSLSARLFKKYNPEKSESDVDDFELFLQKIRTPRLSKLSDERKEREASVNEFIVDDDDDDDDNQEEDVFYDPGFTPELEEISDDDNRNDDIEIATPASTYYTPLNFKTPKSTSSSTSFKSASSRVLLSNHSSRPKSILDNILAPYSTEKEFKKNKDKLIKDLFELYNQTVFDNQMPSDFQITWNPRMRSTAGFCYYSKKNGVRMARIELADKVIDCADRLRDTLIHEMCHAAAWLISGVKAGHGTVWKKWTLRANSVHQDLPPISRCHSYTINAKYTYRCTNNNCSNSFGRHSKSVNLEKSRCAYCHSRLELVPQLKKDGTPQTRTPSKFALFVKQNYARIKSDHDRFSHQDVMKALSTEFAKVSTS